MNTLKTPIFYFIPRQGSTLHEQLNDCLLQLEEQLTLKNLDLKNTLKQTIFLAVNHQEEYYKKTEISDRYIQQFYGPFMPATSVIAQAPENGKYLADRKSVV